MNETVYDGNATVISESSLFSVSKFLSANMGLYFPKERWPDLKRGIVSASRESNHENPESFIQWLLSLSFTKIQVKGLAAHFTIGETYFFRDKNVFNALENHILPELIQVRRKKGRYLRVWSAGCATGEEPYSLAILLLRMIPDLNDWNITIQATDINPEFLKKALKGVYAKWSFRNTPEWVRDRCFKKTKHGHYQIDPRIKKMVNFSFLNLMDTCYPSMASNTNAMDVIFCRNVLMYFVPEYVEQVISRMHKSHVEGGWLVVSPGEMSHLFYSLFKTVYLNGAIFYRKSSPQASSEKNYNMKPALPIQGMVHVCEKYFQPEIFFPERIDTSGKIMPQPQKAIPEPPDSMETVKAPLRGALKLFKDGHYTRAGVSLHELLSRDQDNGDAMALLARTYANQGDLARAADWCEKAIAADKLKPCFYHLFSTIMTEMGRFEAAVDALKKVIYLDYKFVLAYFSLGSINRQQGKLKESEKNFDNAISLLNRMQTEEIVPESEGMTAGRLKEIIKFTSGQEAVHE